MKRFGKITLAVVALATLLGAAPSRSSTSDDGDFGDRDYGNMPKKAEALQSNDGYHQIHEETITPEEVYKHGVQEVSIVATDTGYLPARIFVRKNIPVHLFLTSASPSKLCFIMDDFSIRKGVAIQQVDQVSFLPTKAGEYRFYCPVSEIKGSVVVRD